VSYTRLLGLECEISMWKNEKRELTCVHADKKAEARIRKIRQLDLMKPQVGTVLGHELGWEKYRHRFLPRRF